MTQRWTDEMLDELASSVSELREGMGELRETVGELREEIGELRETVAELSNNVDGVRITAQALLQVAAQQQQASQRHEEEMEQLKQRQAESDERFNTLLAEVRYLIRRGDIRDENEEENGD